MRKSWRRFYSKKYWLSRPIIQQLITWAKKTSLPGFSGVPIYDVLYFIYDETQSDDITTRANSMSFSFFLALFPTLLFLFTLLPLFPNVTEYAFDLNESLKGILPTSSQEFLFEIIDDIVSKQRSGLLSIGLFLALFFASNGMMSLMRGFEKAHEGTFRTRHWLKKRLIAISLTMLIVGIFIVSSGLIILGHVITDFLDEFLSLDNIAVFGFNIIRWIVVIMLIYSSVAVIYRYGPAVIRRFHFFSLGTSLATALIIFSSLGFSYFVSNFGNYNELYGSIGALIVTLLWINIICFILLVGFELNASIAVNRDLKKKKNRHNTSATTNILPPI